MENYNSIWADFLCEDVDIMDIEVRNDIRFRSLPYYITGITCLSDQHVYISISNLCEEHLNLVTQYLPTLIHVGYVSRHGSILIVRYVSSFEDSANIMCQYCMQKLNLCSVNTSFNN
jgi:hypothetical protein